MGDNEQLETLLNEKDDLIHHLKMCLNNAENEINALRKQIHVQSPPSEEKNIIKEIGTILPMLTSNQISLMSGIKKRVNWTSDEIATGFALSYFSRRGYEFLIHKLRIALPSVRSLHEWSENITIAPGILKDSFTVLKALRDNLKEVDSQVKSFSLICLNVRVSDHNFMLGYYQL